MSHSQRNLIELIEEDGEVLLWPHFFPEEEADAYFADLHEHIAWRQEPIMMFGRLIDQPRLTAWYGDPGTTYTYSHIQMVPLPWTETLLAIKRRVETVTEGSFNSVLLNLYRNERDGMGWHSDDEPELGVNPIIASISFGATRRFHLRHRTDKAQRLAVDLTHGSLLLMRGATQHHWQHQISKSARPHEPRINLTFRRILRTGVAGGIAVDVA